MVSKAAAAGVLKSHDTPLTMNSNSTNVPEGRLADFFPRSNGCEKVATSFFQCFSAKSQMSSETDLTAGSRGLNQCLVEKKAYESCMFLQPENLDQKRYRVSFFYWSSGIKILRD